MEPTPPPAPPVVGTPNPLGFYAAAFALYLVGATALRGTSPVVNVLWTQTFAFLLPAVMAAAGANLRPGRFLLLSRPPSRAQLSLGFLCGAAAFLAAGALNSLVSLLFPEAWVRFFDLAPLFEGPAWERALLAVLVSALAPLCEESAFRGFVQSALRGRARPGSAIVLSALLFAIMHLDPVRFVAVFLLGAVFGWLAFRAGSLWPAVAAHAANNAITSVAVLAGAKDVGSTRPEALGSIAALAVGGAALAALAVAYRRATPFPPPLGEVAVPRDPESPAGRFRWARLPPALVAAAALGAALLVAGAAAALRR